MLWIFTKEYKNLSKKKVGRYINYPKKQVFIKQPFIIGTIFYSGIDEGELDGEQIHLLELFAKVPQSKRKIVFELLRNLSDEK